jgi:anaerobic magnesium-protoporphyrin IX monomethyl ester cyclase
MCSYNSPTFLFQPIELLSLAGIFRDLNNGEAYFLDAIAEGVTTPAMYKMIDDIKPDFLVTISGFECFEEDINQINLIKNKFPNIITVLLGHYPTNFPNEVLINNKVNFILIGEPDWNFYYLIEYLKGEAKLEDLKGVSYKAEDGKIFHNESSKRIKDINELPIPAFDLLKNDYYSEPFYPKPYGLIQSARGCPFPCNFCVKSYGSKLSMLSPENMINQVDVWVKTFHIRSFRFIDDTFTVNQNRVIDFCKLLISRNYILEWSCLTRADTLKSETLDWMRKAGCNRLYIGLESGSNEILDFYDKRIDLIDAKENLYYAKKIGFELMGLFMVGLPFETKNDVIKSVNLAHELKIDFIAVSITTPYPGTLLYERFKNDLSFSLIPYNLSFKNKNIPKNALYLQKYFYLKFYISYSFVKNTLLKIKDLSFREFFKNIFSFLIYSLNLSRKSNRKDYV